MAVDRDPQDRRPDGYACPRLPAVSGWARSVHHGLADPTLRGLLRVVRGLPILLRFLWGLPRLTVRLSRAPAGLMIAEHLRLRRSGVPRFRLAQGVLRLPVDFPAYLRGRHRQALRTNMRRARERGIRTRHVRIPDWTPQDRELSAAGPVECWSAIGPGGDVVAEAWVTVDEQCALLHHMSGRDSHGRWLLHTAIVERL